jgi:hypothetical protein
VLTPMLILNVFIKMSAALESSLELLTRKYLHADLRVQRAAYQG